MARGKQPSVSHALPKQQTLLDCFLEAQAKRMKRRRRSADGAASAVSADPTNNDSVGDETEPLPTDAETARAV
ncbi:MULTISPECIES: hypothetical protein [unclassified Bradyrhizobium]|uniref:hypothetical protein n=1 Tax=unclassified Bradyrhizobium TaxID=2631580 RepID=UPI0028E3C514|nr:MULTISPECIES: hypothetical protein [unclassified Bradyrhizobium]